MFLSFSRIFYFIDDIIYLQPETPQAVPKSLAAPTTSTPGLDYESLTLMRLRQAERERLEREIREQEGDASLQVPADTDQRYQ